MLINHDVWLLIMSTFHRLDLSFSNQIERKIYEKRPNDNRTPCYTL